MNKKYMLYVLAAVLIAVFLEVFVYNFHPLLCMDSQDVSFDVTGVAPGMKSSSETLGMTLHKSDHSGAHYFSGTGLY